jgi:hypothetical protein
MCEVVNLALRKAPVVGLREHGTKLQVTLGGERGGDLLISLLLLSSAERIAQQLVCEMARPVRFV